MPKKKQRKKNKKKIGEMGGESLRGEIEKIGGHKRENGEKTQQPIPPHQRETWRLVVKGSGPDKNGQGKIRGNSKRGKGTKKVGRKGVVGERGGRKTKKG